mgnify:CR=1 FL=1
MWFPIKALSKTQSLNYVEAYVLGFPIQVVEALQSFKVGRDLSVKQQQVSLRVQHILNQGFDDR